MTLSADIPGADAQDAVMARLVDDMIEGRAPSEADEPFAVGIALVYEGCAPRGKRRLALRAKIPTDKGMRERLLDVVMVRSRSQEDLRTSISRVAKAVAVMGFKRVDAFTATCAYNTFAELANREF